MSLDALERLRAGELSGARRLDLSAGLAHFPREIFDLADTLEVLNLSGNQLDELPDDLGRLRRLRILFCSDNRFTRLPDCLGDCPALEMVGFKANRIAHVPAQALPERLRWLILTDNTIAELPDALGERPALQKLMLAGNQLTGLPDALAQAHRLELLRISANRLGTVPPWLLALPRLCWLALAGNPLGWQRPASVALPQVPWSSLALGERLGAGASGEIFRVQCRGSEQALKLFKGAVTSDGLPEDELAASLVAAEHPSLVTPQAVLAGHPQGADGLLMPLIPPGFVNLAGPPSFDSCTRDVYALTRSIRAPAARRMLCSMASALAQLHARGVLHGDFYAHNILWRPDTGDALLGDFGAATVLPSDQPVVAAQLQALEVRAFGCLLEEVAEHIEEGPQGQALRASLRAWQHDCQDVDPTRRPVMATLAAALS